MYPKYLNLFKSGELLQRVKQSYSQMRSCKLCPRECGVNRLAGQTGFCKTAKVASVASSNDHHGEEPPISGTKGSGTIFFSNCNMRCIFCQNWPISGLGHGSPATPHALAGMMLDLQKRGCHNINLVTASHVVPQFLAGLYIAAKAGLNIPIVYNSSGYDGMETLKLLDGVVDIYLPDIKYSSRDMSKKYSGAPDYWNAVRPAIKEMYRQCGDLKLDKNGIALQGLIIRHLVLPENISGSKKVLRFIAEEISTETHVALMSQYFPADKALTDNAIKRPITKKEFQKAEEAFHKTGLKNGWIQKL